MVWFHFIICFFLIKIILQILQILQIFYTIYFYHISIIWAKIIGTIPQPSVLLEGLTRRKELIMNLSLLASTGLRIREKYGESILLFLNSEKQLDNFLLLKKKTQEDFSKVLPFSEECIDMVF